MEVKTTVQIPVEVPPEANEDDTTEAAPWKAGSRRFKIGLKDVERFGATPGCEGCELVRLGIYRKHIEECRERFEEKLGAAGDKRIMRQVARYVREEGDIDREPNEVDAEAPEVLETDATGQPLEETSQGDFAPAVGEEEDAVMAGEEDEPNADNGSFFYFGSRD